MAAALVGGAFLSGAFQVLLDRLSPKANIWDLFKTPNSNSKKLLRKLRNTLLSVSKLLDDAEKKEITDPHVKLWLDELKDVVYDADDLLAEIAYDSQAIAGNSVFADDQAGARFQEQLEEILERLAELKEDKDVLGLEGRGREAEAVDHNLPLERRTTSLVDESQVHGREADKETVTRLLMSEETNGTDGLCWSRIHTRSNSYGPQRKTTRTIAQFQETISRQNESNDQQAKQDNPQKVKEARDLRGSVN